MITFYGFFTCVWCAGAHVCTCGSQRTVCGGWFSPSIVQVLGTELRLSGLVAGAFTEWDVSLAQFLLGLDWSCGYLQGIAQRQHDLPILSYQGYIPSPCDLWLLIWILITWLKWYLLNSSSVKLLFSWKDSCKVHAKKCSYTSPHVSAWVVLSLAIFPSYLLNTPFINLCIFTRMY